MFSIVGTTIKITRGDTGIFTFDVMNEGAEYDYSNDTVLFTVKQNTLTTDILFQKQIRYGENVTILPADTDNLSYGEYVYDIQLTTEGGFVDTVITPSKFIVTPEVTFNETNG